MTRVNRSTDHGCDGRAVDTDHDRIDVGRGRGVPSRYLVAFPSISPMMRACESATKLFTSRYTSRAEGHFDASSLRVCEQDGRCECPSGALMLEARISSRQK